MHYPTSMCYHLTHNKPGFEHHSISFISNGTNGVMGKLRAKNTHFFTRSVLLFLACTVFPISCFAMKQRSAVAKLSVSSDGKYALSSHHGQYLVLWDIKNRKSHILNQHTNIHSAFFIQDTHYFLWQDANTLEVHVQSVDGQRLKTLKPGVVVYGHAMTTDLKHYAASEGWRNLHWFMEDGSWRSLRERKNIDKASVKISWMSAQNNHFLITGRNGFIGKAYPFEASKETNSNWLEGVVLWSAETGEPEQQFINSSYMTVADLSVGARYVAAGGGNDILYVWDTQHGTRVRMENPINPGIRCGERDAACKYKLVKKLASHPKVPQDFVAESYRSFSHTAAVRFIDESGYFIRFIETSHYGVLYHVSSPIPLAYMDLGFNPRPYTTFQSGSPNSIASAPKSHILVVAQSKYKINQNDLIPGYNYNGILVYRFHPKTKQLELLWAPDGPPDYEKIFTEEVEEEQDSDLDDE